MTDELPIMVPDPIDIDATLERIDQFVELYLHELVDGGESNPYEAIHALFDDLGGRLGEAELAPIVTRLQVAAEQLEEWEPRGAEVIRRCLLQSGIT